MATTEVLPGEALIDELNEIRGELRMSASRRGPRTREEGAASRRKGLRGGSDNHAFTGEQYLNNPVKEIRRISLQKSMDEGGQTNFGGPIPSHPTLAKWEAKAYGLTDDEIRQLEQEDLNPEALISRGWRIFTTRHEHFAVSIGTSYVGEGGTYLRSVHEPEKVKQELDDLRKMFEGWGVEDLDSATANAVVHAEADEDHGLLTEDVIKRFCNTPELQEKMRRTFILRHYSRAGLY